MRIARREREREREMDKAEWNSNKGYKIDSQDKGIRCKVGRLDELIHVLIQ
jgi:hypothetical protein